MKVARAVCAAVIVFASPAVAQEDRDAAFKAGLDAREDKKWQETATHMRRAIQSNPREDSRRVTRGLLGIGGRNEYLPFYFLGEALFNLGDCAGAVTAWSASERQGVVRARPDYVATFQKGYRTCEGKGVLPPGKFDPLFLRGNQHVTEVNSQAAAISERGKVHITIWRADANLREAYDRGSAELQIAQSRLAIASRTRSESDFVEAKAAVDRARALFTALGERLDAAIAAVSSAQGVAREVDQSMLTAQELDRTIDGKKAFITPALSGVRDAANESMGRVRAQLSAGRAASNMAVLNEARATVQGAVARFKYVLEEIAKVEKRLSSERLSEVIGKANEAFSFVEGAFRTLDARLAAKPVDATPDRLTRREALQKQFAALGRRRDAAARAGNVAGLEQAAQLASEVRIQVDRMNIEFGPLTIVDRGVRPELAEGARLFFAGEYEQVLATLDPERLNDVPLQLHVHLFRAAALYALYVRSGEKDQAHRTQALAEVQKCKQLSPGFQPAGRAFAPRFISFFQTGNASAPRAAAPPS